jgi:uncharacterized protein (DUF1800 family)
MYSLTELWEAYKPDAQAPWNLRRVVHLHRRAGFAATWNELQRDLKDGPDLAITRLVKGETRAEGVPEDFASIADMLGNQALESSDVTRLKAWWLYCMLWTPDPLGERLTLLWHNHFATSNAKVENPSAMRRQNQIFREFGRGPFGKLLKAVVHDPAMLIWLDAPANRKGQPNENLARELMELFTLGIGHYTETDVKEGARALTGWKIAQGAFRDWSPDHDEGEKTLLGRRGHWKGDDFVRMLLEHPATARRLAWRLCEWLMGENAVDAAGLDALATELRAHDLNIGWGIETVLRSRRFFAANNLGNRVLGPVEYLIGTARALETFDPPPSSILLTEWAARLGQDLLYPPNVGGWSGGRDWLTTQGIIGRANYSAALAEGRVARLPTAPDFLTLAHRHQRGRDIDDLLAFYTELLTGTPPDPAWRKHLRTALGPHARLDANTARLAVALIAAAPETQLA